MPSMPALAEGDDAHDLPGIAEARSGRDQDAQPLALGQALDLDPGRQSCGDGCDLLRGGAIAAQGRLEGFALAEDEVALLDEGSGGLLVDLRQLGHVLGHDPHLDRAEGRIDDAGIAQGIAEPIGLPQGPRQHLLGRDRHGGPASRLVEDPALLLEDGEHVAVRQGRRARLDGDEGKIPPQDRDIGVGHFRRRLDPLLVHALGEEPEGVEGRDIGGIGAGA